MSVEFMDATTMAEAVRSGQVSSKELVQDSIRRIEADNPRLNAVVSSRFDQALAEAEALEVADKPFAGVPILLKDLGQNQAGELSTSGSRLFANYRASQSDNMVKRLEELGFIVLGRTSTPEFGFKNISDSQLHGPVNLPDDLTRNAGGSSGGAGAAVASGMVPLAGASDGGGSIRIPASFNGLIGLKPSRGRIPVGPTSYRGWQGASVHFALTKTVRDTRNLLYHLQTCQLESPFVLPKLDYKSLYQSALNPLKIALLLKPPYLDSFSEDAQTAVRRAGHFLESLGHQVEELAEAPLNSLEAIRGYYVMNSVETAAMFDGIERSLGRAVTKDDMEVMTWAIYQSGQSIPAKCYSAILQDWDRYSATMAKFHQTYDMLITPTTNRPAPKHGELTPAKDLMEQLARAEDFSWQEQQDLIWQMFKPSLDWNPYTSQANLTGQPAINLPVHRTKEGLAMGIQLTAAKGREDLLLQLADLFEEAGQFR